MAKTRILILAANPSDTDKLQLELELLKLELLRQNAKLKESFELKFALAVQDEDLQRTLLDFKPDIVHFCGHGEVDGLFLCDKENKKQFVHAEAISNLFKEFADTIRCVVLNACYTEEQAGMISQHIDYVVGMKKAIGDEAAIKFATGFYNAVFAGEDFSKAYKLGCNAIDLANIPEYATPVLECKPKTFVPGFKHDVFISFADTETQWAKDLTDYLRKFLTQKLETVDGFQLYTGNDLQQLEHSASLLVIVSPAYSLHYQNNFPELEQAAKQRPVFLVETDMCNPRPDFLRGFTPHKFWFYDDSAGMTQKISGDNYFVEANKLVCAIADKLKELNNQHQHQENLNQQIQQQRDARDSNINSDIDALVFLHTAPEDLNLTADILPLLKENGIDYMLPLPRSEKIKAEDICQDIENNIRKCDAVLILYRESSPVWIREQLVSCRTLQRERKTPLKIIAVHKAKEDNLSCSLKNFQIYDCPPEEAKTYFPRFIEALKK